MYTFLKVNIKIFLLLAISIIDVKAQQDNDGMRENFLTRICLDKFAYEMKNANISPPKGMGNFTCKCFLNEINQGKTINEAQNNCKNKAAMIFQ